MHYEKTQTEGRKKPAKLVDTARHNLPTNWGSCLSQMLSQRPCLGTASRRFGLSSGDLLDISVSSGDIEGSIATLQLSKDIVKAVGEAKVI